MVGIKGRASDRTRRRLGLEEEKRMDQEHQRQMDTCCALCETREPGTNAPAILLLHSDSWKRRARQNAFVHSPSSPGPVPIVCLRRRGTESIKLCRASCESVRYKILGPSPNPALVLWCALTPALPLPIAARLGAGFLRHSCSLSLVPTLRQFPAYRSAATVTDARSCSFQCASAAYQSRRHIFLRAASITALIDTRHLPFFPRAGLLPPPDLTVPVPSGLWLRPIAVP